MTASEGTRTLNLRIECVTAVLLDRLTHHCRIFEMNGESYRFRESIKKSKQAQK